MTNLIYNPETKETSRTFKCGDGTITFITGSVTLAKFAGEYHITRNEFGEIINKIAFKEAVRLV